MATFPPGFLEDVKSRTSVSDIVGRKVKLIRRGREFVGLSPFNAEKSPSFTVNDAKGFYHCFSSGEHGDVFSFLMKTEGLSFPEAVETIASMVGVDMPKVTPEDRQQAERAKGLREAVASAAHFFETQLRMPAGAKAMAYLKERGLADETMKRFRLGYAPIDRMALLAALRHEGFDDEVIVEAGLARRGDDGRVFGYFKDRVIYTIADPQGRAIGFGARALGDAQPKYLNSPDGPLFHKGETLYGLDLAREPAHKAGEIIVVEGYMDVIALAEAGVPNVVAPLGTAVTEAQIKRLWRIAAAPTLCLDGDAAGRKAAGRAALRALPILEPGRTLKFALLDGGRDPDDLVRAEGAAAINRLTQQSTSLVDIIWQDALREIDPSQPEQRAALDKRLHELAREIADETVGRYIKDAFRERLRTAFSPAPKRFENKRFDGKKREPPGRILQRPSRPAGDVGRSLNEARVLFGCSKRPEVAEQFLERLAHLSFDDSQLNQLRQAIVEALANNPAIDADGLLTTLMALGHDHAIHRMQKAVRGRPTALMGDVVDAAEWLNISIEAIEKRDAEQSFLKRARALTDDDDHAIRAVELDVMEHVRGRNVSETR
ncbi:MAG: DNA primase [Alphaproteobacteria bacterium]